MSRNRLLPVALLCAVVAASCGGTDTAGDASPEAASLTIGTVASPVQGNVVQIPVSLRGFNIVAADGDTSGTSGHFHVFIDREPVPVGQVMPVAPDILHTTENPILVTGLTVGEHTLTVVAGDGLHQRIEGLDDSVTVTVEGPSVTASAPATVESGEPVTIEIASEGLDIVAADEDTSGETGHYHILVDPESAPQPGETILPAEENKIVHTTESSYTFDSLPDGEHTIWVVAGDGTHKVIDPLIAARFKVTVG